jgi:formylglycine-generating enzyme required for sulfatase activity
MWEKAARGTDGRRWPWGNEWDAGKLNSSDSGIGRTSAVGIFPAGKSPFGVYDAAGNVLEWCSNPGYSVLKYPFKQRPYEEDLAGAESRALRGGAWNYLVQFTRAACRYNNHPVGRNGNVGFRVAEHLSDPDS